MMRANGIINDELRAAAICVVCGQTGVCNFTTPDPTQSEIAGKFAATRIDVAIKLR
jgi:hypothetical protein